MNPSHELPNNTGKSYIGLIHPYGAGTGCLNADLGYFALSDKDKQVTYFEVSCTQYQYICQTYNQLLSIGGYYYAWVEVDTLGKVQNVQLFCCHLPIQDIAGLFSVCYNHSHLINLFNLINQQSIPALKQFLKEIVSDYELISRFIKNPASKNHHHSHPGGLLEHSLECEYITALALAGLSGLSENEKNVARIASLLHDIGKIYTLSQGNRHMLHHENLTLVVLAKPLEKLSQQWNEGAQVLQYLLMWKESMGFCRFVSGNAIKMADHISTAMSLSQKAFEKLPSHYHFAKLNTGHQEHYLNRLN